MVRAPIALGEVTLFELTVDQIRSLPLDELGLLIVRHLADMQQAGNTPNRRNVLNDAVTRGLGRAAPALSEALTWLEANVLVAPTPDQDGRDWLMITRQGIEMLTAGSTAAVKAARRLDVDLHPRIRNRARRQFLMGEYELAALAALREVEIRVRELAGAPESAIGVNLMKDAFKKGGVLSDASLDGGEHEARMFVFAGAIGLFKNPASHRQVEYDDPTEAAEVILFADLLMRILERVPAAGRAQPKAP